MTTEANSACASVPTKSYCVASASSAFGERERVRDVARLLWQRANETVSCRASRTSLVSGQDHKLLELANRQGELTHAL